MTKSCLHTGRGLQTNGESPNNTLPSSISLLKAHYHKPRGAQEHNGRQETKLRTQTKGHWVWSPARAVLGQSQPQCPGVKPIMTRKCQSTFWTEWVSLPEGMGHLMGCSFGLHGTYYGMFRGGTKCGKRDSVIW